MKYKKTIVSLFVLILIIGIYRFYSRKDFIYVPLGDSLAAGRNPYGEEGYGYTDYVATYLEKNNLLKEYVRGFATSGYTTKDLKKDIDDNKTIRANGKEHNIRRELRESDIVTISIGANDFLNNIDQDNLNFSDITLFQKIVDDLIPDLESTLKKVREYAKEEVIVVGYYNPIPFLFNTNEAQMDQLFAYIDDQYRKVAKKYQCDYLSIYSVFKKGTDYLPNPSDIHPNMKGYEAISKEIIDFLDKNILN